MVFSPVSSTSYSRAISPPAEGQSRGGRHFGHMFSLRTTEVAHDEMAEVSGQTIHSAGQAQQITQNSLEKWLRLMGAASQLAYQGQQQDVIPANAANTRYRLQRTYFDQERQVSPQTPVLTDQRLQAYHAANGYDTGARAIDFVV